MLRSTFALAAACLVALTAGCRMCAHPYDYSGPTFTGEDCQQCTPNARACSILSPEAPPCSRCETTPEMMAPVPDEYGGMVFETAHGQTVVRYVTEKPAGTAPPAGPRRTAAGPSDRMR